MAELSKIILPDGSTYDFKDAIARVSIPFGQVDSTSTATAFTATIPEITEYYDGLIIMLKNGVVTSAEGFTININGLGGRPVYTNLATAAVDTIIFNTAYTMLFVYDSSLGNDGGWICYQNVSSILTDQEINDAVEAAFPASMYSISYAYDYIKDNGNLMSVSTDGSKVLGEYATTAEEGSTITMWCGGRYEPIVTRSDTSAEITCTRIEVDTSSGRKTTWTCAMPGVGIVINTYYND